MQPDFPAAKQWSTPMGLVVLGWVLVVAAAIWWSTSDTATDRVFIGTVVVGLVVATGYASVCRPRLRADVEGIAVRGLRGLKRWSWSQVTVTVEHHQRLGRPAELLQVEVDGSDDLGMLIVFSRLDLGEAPHDVAEALRALRP